jgi:hypothetical protein
MVGGGAGSGQFQIKSLSQICKSSRQIRGVESLRKTADYAFLAMGQEVKIAFESDLEAEVARRLLGARIIERGGDKWASVSMYFWTTTPPATDASRQSDGSACSWYSSFQRVIDSVRSNRKGFDGPDRR